MKYASLFLIAAAISIVVSTSAQMKSGETIVIDEPVNDDLYVAGGTVTINAPVRGDLIVAGGTIIVNDTVAQDLLAAGGSIAVNGPVRDDIRCAGGSIQVSGTVSGDLVAAGGEVRVMKGATVSGDLLISGGEVALDGTVGGDVKSASGTLAVNGVIHGKVECRGSKITVGGDIHGKAVLAADAIAITPEARFASDVRYWSRKGPVDFGRSVQGGVASFDSALEIEDGRWHYLGFASFMLLLWYLATALVMMVVIHYLFSRTLKNAAATIATDALKALGVGFLFLVGVPVAAAVFFVTIIGIPVGVLILVGYLTVVLVATILVALLITNWINTTHYASAWGNSRIIMTAFGIFIVLKLFSLTPFVGPLVMLMMACVGFGGILMSITFRKNKTLVPSV